MDQFLKSIKQKFSVDNLIETIRDELDDTKKPDTAEPIANVKQPTDKPIEDNLEVPDELTKSDSMKKPPNIQIKQPSTQTANILQKPNPPDEETDPYQETENLFSFCN